MNKDNDILMKDVFLTRISLIMDMFYCQVSAQR